MIGSPPDKIHLIPDEWHIHHVGRLADGWLFLVDAQLDFSNQPTKDFVCTFVFDADGKLVSYVIDLIGERGAYPQEKVVELFERHLSALGPRTNCDIWVRPFSIQSHGTEFGLVPVRLEDGEWYVQFMPGNTLSFYAPWAAGEYDT